MIQMMENGDKYSVSKIDAASLTQMISHDDNPPLHILFTKLNIPISCLDNHHIRQHYLEEYSAKYSKAKYLLSNARKKQRKIIMTYYEEKAKQDNIDELQTVKESLLEENDKIKKFKEALKDKLIIYQQRIQFLKDAEFWSALEIEQLQNNTTEKIQISTENSLDLPTTNDSLHLLHDHEYMKYSDHLPDDSCPSNMDDHDDSKPNLQFDDIETILKQSQTEIDENIDRSTFATRIKHCFQWLKDSCQLFFILTSNDQFQIISMILMISLAIFLVIFLNDLLEHLLIYLTKSSVRIATLSPRDSMPKSLFANLLSNIYNWTTSWLLPFSRLFEYSV